MRLSSAIQNYIILNYGLSGRTRQIYQEHLQRLCYYLDDPPVTGLDPLTVARFMASLRRRDNKPYSAGYLDQIHRTLHAFFEFCVAESWIAANPMARLKHPRVEHGRKPRLSLKQVQQLLNAVKMTEQAERNLAMVLLMVDSGLRVGEVVALQAGDVCIEEKRLFVRAPKVHASRDVPLSDMAGLALTAYLKKRPPVKSTREPFFLTAKGPRRGQPITRKAIEELMKRLKRQLKFPLYAHLLRHTFGNHFIRKGGLKHLQKILGHSRIDTTARFYTDPDFEDIQQHHRLAAPSAQLGL